MISLLCFPTVPPLSLPSHAFLLGFLPYFLQRVFLKIFVCLFICFVLAEKCAWQTVFLFMISQNAFILPFLLSKNVPKCTIKIWHFRTLNTLLSPSIYLFLRKNLLSIDCSLPCTLSFLSSNFRDCLLTFHVPQSCVTPLSVDSNGIIFKYSKANLTPEAAVFLWCWASLSYFLFRDSFSTIILFTYKILRKCLWNSYKLSSMSFNYTFLNFYIFSPLCPRSRMCSSVPFPVQSISLPIYPG